MLTGAILTAVIALVFNSPIGQAVAMTILLAVVIAIWLVRRFSTAAQPSESFTGLLALLLGLSITLSILAIPLAPALFLPQLAVGAIVAGFLVPPSASREVKLAQW